jgi:hypothetical protein
MGHRLNTFIEYAEIARCTTLALNKSIETGNDLWSYWTLLSLEQMPTGIAPGC